MSLENVVTPSSTATNPEKSLKEGHPTSDEPLHTREAKRFKPPPRSPSSVRRIRIQNRRRQYLERHPSYFEGESHGYVDEEAAERKEMVGMVGKEAVGPFNFFAIMFNFLPLSSLSRVSVYKYHVKSDEFRSCT